jgi:hypothetical protein
MLASAATLSSLCASSPHERPSGIREPQAPGQARPELDPSYVAESRRGEVLCLPPSRRAASRAPRSRRLPCSAPPAQSRRGVSRRAHLALRPLLDTGANCPPSGHHGCRQIRRVHPSSRPLPRTDASPSSARESQFGQPGNCNWQGKLRLPRGRAAPTRGKATLARNAMRDSEIPGVLPLVHHSSKSPVTSAELAETVIVQVGVVSIDAVWSRGGDCMP